MAQGGNSFQLRQWDVTTPSYIVLICKLKITVHALVQIVMSIKYWMLKKKSKCQLKIPDSVIIVAQTFLALIRWGLLKYKWQNTCHLLSHARGWMWDFRWGSIQKLKPL